MALSLRQKAQFYQQMQAGSQAGLPPEQLLLPAVVPKAMARSAEQLYGAVLAGKPLSAALLAAKVVKPWEARLLAIGESAGKLENSLAALARFFDSLARQLATLQSSMVYPGMVLLVAITVTPLPAVAAGELGTGAYLLRCALLILLARTLYRLFIVTPFERGSGAAFNPMLLRIKRRLHNEHWLCLLQEIAWVDLLVLCLESGMDAAEALTLLRDSTTDKDSRLQHQRALNLVQKNGLALTQALGTSGLVKHPQVLSFLHSSEQSGTLHSDLRIFVARKGAEADLQMKHQITLLSRWLYLLVVGLVLLGFM